MKHKRAMSTAINILTLTLITATLLTTTIGPITCAASPSFTPKQDFATGTNPQSVTVGDLNGDGKLDLVIANFDSNTVSVLLNTTTPGAATPTFAAKQDFATGSEPKSVAMDDLNGDGKLDLIVADFGASSVSVLLNTTTPGAATFTFAAKQDFATGTIPQSVAVGDLNGDGELDLAVANFGSNTVSVLLNTTTPGAATPSFAAKQDFATGSDPESVMVVDLNGDGKRDLVIANTGDNTVSVLLNITAPGAATPSFAAKQDFATGSEPLSVAVGDLNGDGKLDLVTANFNSNNVSVLLNTTTPGAATPTFAAKQDFATGSEPKSVAMGDLNGDGELDLAVANFGSNTVSVLLNTTTPGAATPTFAAKQDFGTGTSPESATVGDLNGDGKRDLVIANGNDNTVSALLNTTAQGNPATSFTAKQDFATGTGPDSVAVGDLNGDGKLDLVIVNNGANTVSVLLNITAPGAATPSFAAHQDFGTGFAAYSVALGDLNGDGKLDLVVTNSFSSTVSVLLNTTTPGAATFTFAAKHDFATGLNPQSVALGDLNGDGQLDLVTANAGFGANTVSVLLNTTTPGAATPPSFAAKQDFTTGLNPFSVAVGDLNGDGQLDLVTANSGAPTVSVLLNTTAPGDATASFAAKQDFTAGLNPWSVAVGDLNGDGKLDLVIANSGATTVSVLLNTTAPGDATPTFATHQDFTTGPTPESVAVGDLNGDGKRDLVIANTGANTVSVLLNATVSPTAANGSVSGTITDSSGAALSGVTINLSGTQSAETITDSSGNYSFDGVETNGFYTVTPARVNYTFSPANRSFSLLGVHTEASFTAAGNGDRLNAIDTTEFFVRQQYLDFLGREPDEAGFNFWSDQILTCNSDASCVEGKRINVSAAFFLSIEFQQTGYLVYRMYHAAYGDLPGAPLPLKLSEFTSDRQEIGNGVVVNGSGWQGKLEANTQAYATDFVQRTRFTSLYAGMNDAQFVDTLNQNAGFVLSQADRDQLVSDLSTQAKTRAQALRSVAENATLQQQEFNQAFVAMEYFGYLRRDPDSEPDTDFSGYDFWLNKLNTFNGSYQDAEMVKAFLVSGEYRGRFPR